MPGTRCTVAVCNNSYNKTKRAGINIKYHIFPTSQPVRDIWIERTGRTGKWNPDTCHICSIHFTQDDYTQNLSNNSSKLGPKRLRPTAVPSMFLTEPAPINVPLLTPRKRRKTSLSDKTPTYSNEENILHSQDALNHFDTIIDYIDDSTDFDSQLDLENLQYLGKHKINDELETEEDSCHSSKKHCVIMRNIATETTPDYFIDSYQHLMDENKKLKSKLVKLNIKHEKLLSNMKLLESKIENLKLSTLIHEL